METQTSFTFSERELSEYQTNRKKFLESMNQSIPWQAWIKLIKKYYYKSNMGRPQYSLEIMLRIYLVQNWFSLADNAMEQILYDSRAIGQFVGVTSPADIPDETTILRFRHLLEENKLQEQLFKQTTEILNKKKLQLKHGTIVDATIIDAPASVKNSEKQKLDKDAGYTKKGLGYHFGYKAHIGVDAKTGLVHTNVVTPANESDVSCTHRLLRKKDKFCHGDAGYVGVEKRDEIANDKILSKIKFKINRRLSQWRNLPEAIREKIRKQESRKSKIRSVVEFPFGVVKQIFKFRKTRYRGLEKNKAKMNIMFALSNIYMMKKRRMKIAWA